MKRYAIKRDLDAQGRVLGLLNYDEEKGMFTIDIPEDVPEKEAPFLLSLFIKRGQRHIDADWSLRWVQSRIVPVGRQNIGQILRENGMKQYDEHKLLIKNQGRCCQDECYIEELKSN